MVNPSVPPTASPRLRPPTWSGLTWLGCGGIAVAVMAFYLWTAQTPAAPFSIGPRGSGYYNLLADGFLAGQLSLPVQPDPELLKLKNPYDPAQQAPKLHDASFYKGKYYLYFGAAPALVLFVPWDFLTHRSISENLAVALFCCAGYAVWSLLILQVMRRHFPQAGGGLAMVMVLLLGLGNMCVVLLRRAAFWEVPIASAYFFNALCFWFVCDALAAPRRRSVALAFASASLGLAIGSRPGCVFITPGLGLLALWLARPGAAGDRWISGRTVRLLVAAVVPVTLCVLAVLLYNYLRFDDPFEFGTTYQLAGHNMHTWKMLDWANVPINIYHYFFSRAQFSVYFPFFEVIGAAPFKAPKDYYGVENVYGVLPNLPVVVFGLGAFGVFFHRRWREAAPLRLLVASLVFAFLAGLPVLLRYSAANSRYMVDFVPGLIALAIMGILAGEAVLAESPRSRRSVFRACWIAAAAYTIIFNVLVSFQHNDLLRLLNPPAYARLAGVFNRISPLLEKLTGDDHGPLEVRLRLPKNRHGQLEPLVVTGLSFRADFIYLYYTDARHIQVGFEHTGYGGGISQPIAVDYDGVQTIRIEMGSLYPPESHPFFAHAPASRIVALKRQLKVWVNGVPYLDFNAMFNESSPKDVVVGRDPIYGAFGRKFSGTILAVARANDVPNEGGAPRYGSVRLAVQFPMQRTGFHEPLVVTGRAGRGDIFYVSYLDAKTVRFTIDHWGVGEVKSEPVEVNYDHIHVFEIDLGSMRSPPAGAIAKQGFLAPYEVRMDGTVIMQGETLFHPSPADEIYLLLNPIGGSTAAPNFTGRILVKEPLHSSRAP